jgi:hypothetical protein
VLINPGRYRPFHLTTHHAVGFANRRCGACRVAALRVGAVAVSRAPTTDKQINVMSFEYACFVSYRHLEQSELAERFIDD